MLSDVERAIRLLEEASGTSLEPDVVQQICGLTGGHPAFLQMILHDLWEYACSHGDIDNACIQYHKTGWDEHFAQLPREICSTPQCQEALRLVSFLDPDISGFYAFSDNARLPEWYHQLEEARRLLKYWGVLHEVDKHKHAYTNSFFHEWFTPFVKKTMSEYFERGLDTLRKKIDGNSDLLSDFGMLEHRLTAVNREIDRWGASEEKRSRRAEIIDQLNDFCIRVGLNATFHKTCQGGSY